MAVPVDEVGAQRVWTNTELWKCVVASGVNSRFQRDESVPNQNRRPAADFLPTCMRNTGVLIGKINSATESVQWAPPEPENAPSFRVKERKGRKSQRAKSEYNTAYSYSLRTWEYTLHTHLDQSSIPKRDIFRQQLIVHSRSFYHMQFELSDTWFRCDR